ncbi:MAG TPA: FAD-dependent oxidoreductase [Steroidobacter sp.]|uniref:flavin monoamine oxidase family protein n=1 Tax=Steroidobacter sp. TaxID=1978227 RepID=UPI002ED7F69E
MSQLTRRTFMSGAAAAAVGAATMRAQPAKAARTNAPARDARADVIVIGAGLSGLWSAVLLEEAGLDVQVIEARDRVGGRVFTRFDLPGHPEVGGSVFGSGYGRVLDAARRMGLPLTEVSRRGAAYAKTQLVMNGQIVPEEEWPTSRYNRLPKEARSLMPWQLPRFAMAGRNPLKTPEDWHSPAVHPFDVSVHAYLSERGVADDVIRLAYSENPYFGTSAHDVSVLMYGFNDVWGLRQVSIGTEMYAVAGGNYQLPKAMAAKLQRPVDLNREIVAISTDSDGATVQCVDGSRYQGRRVICSLPYSVVRNVRFDPVLSGRHAAAVATVPYMINTMIFLRPLRPFWEQDGLSPAMWTDSFIGTVSATVGDKGEVTCIVVNPRGRKAAFLDRLPREEAIRRVIAEIESIRPAARGALECVGYHSWDLDPYSRGDWAVYAPGQITQFGPAMASVHGRVHFCGEHTAVANRGMEAALESAERAAIEVVSSL